MGEVKALQDANELAAFIEILRSANVRSYLEIGSKFGGSLWRVANTLPVGSRVVSVDLPKGDGSLKYTEPSLLECIGGLNALGYDIHLIVGDSTAAATIEKAKALGPYDAVFIDANHSLQYVTADWNNYGPMGRIVAFHDIAWRRGPDYARVRIEVPTLWAELRTQFKHREIVLGEKKKDNGIGVLFR